MLSGGGKRDDLKPLGTDGSITPGVRGNHRANAAALNVHNARPGFVYYWARHPRADRGGTQLQRMQQWGWEVVPPDAPEHKSREQSLHYAELGLDGYQAHGDVLLLRIPESKYRDYRAFQAHQAKVAYEGVTADYLDKSSEFEDRFGATADGPIYYRASGHGTRSD